MTTAREILQETFDNLTSFFLDHVAEDVLWENAYPELDELRTHIGLLLENGEGLNS